MAKKNENNSGNTFLVDVELLSQGLKTAFTGIAMVFDSLGAARMAALRSLTNPASQSFP